MIKKIEIENYKSLENLSMELGRFNVLIGENGCGKTNILESLVFAAAGVNGNIDPSSTFKSSRHPASVSARGKIENSFIDLRGGRMSEPKSLRSGFEQKNVSEEIIIKISENHKPAIELVFNNDNQPFSKWQYDISFKGPEFNLFFNPAASLPSVTGRTLHKYHKFYEYIIYAPENFFLRNVHINETYLEPIGSRGQGFLKLIKIIKKEKPQEYAEIIHHLHLIDWFDNFDINEDFNADSEFTLSDKYLEDGLKSFDIRNANEGFLFVLFYLTIFISDYTPKFFAIDNIDTALNPKLCSKLISVLAELAKKHDKQVIITTHNPSVLDGLNLNDDEERLFVIARNKSGRTRATRIEKKPAVNGTAPVKLSEQFLRGYIGGLPKNF